MAGQTLVVRTFASINLSSKCIITNRINQVNFKPPYMGVKNDAKSLIDRYQIPEKPKRPLSAFFRFMLHQRPIVVKENPSLHNKDVVKSISEQWRALSATDRAKYEELAIIEKGKYDEKILKYNATLTPEQEEVLHQIQSDRRDDKKKRKIKKENREAGKPKRPITSFGIFLVENTKGKEPLGDFMADLKVKWAQMSEVEKEKYQIQYQRNREKYEIELGKWEAEMVAEGKSHLVRVKTLKRNPSFEEKIKKIKPQ